MGALGIGTILGHAAGGFEQARQQDLQRQFADEQNRRAMAGDLLQKIALDPNHPQEVRVAAGKTYLGLSQMPGNKTFDFGKQLGPVFDLMAKYQGAARQPSGPPPPPPGIQGLAEIGGPTPAQANQLPIVAGAPPAPGGVGPTQTPAITLPPPPAPPAGMPIAQAGPPPAQPPTGEFLAGPQTIAQNTQALAAAQAQGQVAGGIAGRQPFLNQIPELSPTEKASLGLGLGAQWLRASNMTVGSGGGYAGQLRSQGELVPANIPDNQWVNMKELGGGRKTFEPGAAPGEKALGGAQLGTPGEIAQQQANIRYGYWQKENNTRFGQQLALQDRAFQNAIATGDYRGAKTVVFGADKDYQQAVSRMHTMDENYQDYLKTGSQQAQLSLLANHLGMTAGAQKGMRIARATMEEAMESAPKTQTIMAKFFHQDASGDYVFDGWKGGVNLTKDQASQMVDLAHQKVNVLHDTVDDYHNLLKPELGGAQMRGTPNAPTKMKGKNGPPAPPEGTRPPLSSFEH